MLAAQDLIVTIAAVSAGALLLRRTVFAPGGEGDDASCPRCDSGGTCPPSSAKPVEPEVRPLLLIRNAAGQKPKAQSPK